MSLRKMRTDPNEKICETWQVLGSRLAVRRVCATRAEWADRRLRERDIIYRTQTQRCAVNPERVSARLNAGIGAGLCRRRAAR
jgi:hypothetical protein